MNFEMLSHGLSHLMVKRVLSPFWIRRRWLEKTQWLGQDQLRQIQLKLLKRIVTHSYNTVPFYKKLMAEHKITPEDIKTLDDIKLFPVLTKAEVLKAKDSMLSSRYPKWTLRKARTGGSTGSPLIVYRNWSSIGNEHAFVRRQWDWAGLEFGDRCAYLMSRVVASVDQQNGQLYAYDPIMKELILSTHHLSTQTARQYALAMKRHYIKAIVGYPSAISFLAKTCLDSGIALDLRAALTTSELLTPAMRQIISQAFNCKVFDFYGSAERTCYIQTCWHGSYHLIPEYGLTELIPEQQDGKYCKVIATGFWNFAMPLIRYDTGDIVIKSDKACRCGRQFQTIESINGRAGDVIRTPSGRFLGVTLIIQLLYVICGTRDILESQIVQDRIDHLTIKYVPAENFTTQDLDDFSGIVRKYLPSELKFDFKKVKSIEKTDHGKVRPLVSLIN